MREELFGTALFTGCGGDIAIALARIAREGKLCSSLLGADSQECHAGWFHFDRCMVLPRIESPDYFDALDKLIRKYQVHVIVVGSEPELRGYYAAGIDGSFSGVPAIMANREALRVGLDKLETACLLKSRGMASPWTSIVSEGPPQSLPCILKSRIGWGGRSVTTVSTPEQVRDAQRNRPNDIFQEYLGSGDDEYTCGVYRSGDGEIRSIVFRRKLLGGLTQSGVTVRNRDIEEMNACIAEAVELNGSINVQLRMTERGPVAFEINPRFSGTAMFRHRLGFRDFVWSLQEAAGLEMDGFEQVEESIEFYRDTREIFLRNKMPWKTDAT